MRRAYTALLIVTAMAPSGAALAWPDSKAPWVFDIPNGGTNCQSLPSSVDPIRYDVSFEGDIRTFLSAQCNTCHISGSSGGMNLNFGNARLNLIGANETGTPSQGDSARLRVAPFKPLDSILFEKLNCANPPFGSQMPIGSSASSEFQALVHDWIAAGALMPDSPGGDRTFTGGFEEIVRP